MMTKKTEIYRYMYVYIYISKKKERGKIICIYEIEAKRAAAAA